MAEHFGIGLLQKITLCGECNRCGLCCVEHVGKDRLICEHLEMSNLGHANGTRCRVYDRRYDGMPIVMFADDGGGWVPSVCFKDSPGEVHAILEKGIDQGCSLTVELKEG